MIPMCDLAAQYATLREEIDGALREAAAAGRYILGPNVKAFEREVAVYCGRAHAVGVNSGTDALLLALRAMRIGAGDEVITTPFSFIATTEAIVSVGATPVFVDIDPWTYNMDTAQIEAAITPRTRAILPVHLYGQPCEMAAVMRIAERHHLGVIEDCAQAMGAVFQGRRAGAIGHVGCFSFFPSKNLGALGDGGMVVTDDAEIAERVEMLRRHGGQVKYFHTEIGMNSRLDELQAAVLRVKLRHLQRWLALRRQHAYAYNRHFIGWEQVVCPRERVGEVLRVPGQTAPFEPELYQGSYHQYTVRVADREAVRARMKEIGIETMVYYPVPLHRQAVHADLGYADGRFPRAEAAARTCLSLPIYPEMSAEQHAVVCRAMEIALEAPVTARAA